MRTSARDRDEYLGHPPSGEWIRDEDAARIAAAYPTRRPSVQVVVSDGLSAEAVHHNLRRLLPVLLEGFAGRGLTNAEIADRLFLSPRTVASHLYRSYPKLGIAGRHQLHDLIAQAGIAPEATPVE